MSAAARKSSALTARVKRSAATSGTAASPIGATLKAVRIEPAALGIERQIKAAILKGQFRTGDHLGSEHELASKLGVSRLPVREAMGRLQALGLVEVKTGAGGGARVAAGNPGHVAELLAIQLVLAGLDAGHVLETQRIVEVAAAGLAAKHAGPAEIEQLETALRDAEQAVNDPSCFPAAAMRFHAAIGDASGNRFLSVIMRAIALALEQVVAPDTTVELARSVVLHHRKLLQAIKSGDEIGANRLLNRHLDRVHLRIRNRLAGHQ